MAIDMVSSTLEMELKLILFFDRHIAVANVYVPHFIESFIFMHPYESISLGYSLQL